MIVARQSTARTITVGPVLDASGAAVTDSVVGDFKIAKNGGAPGALNGSATLTHRHTGNYSLALTASDLDTVGSAEITCDDTVNACAVKEITVIEEAVYDELFASSALGYIANAPVNVAQIEGSDPTDQIRDAATAGAPTAATIADTVWDEASSGHQLAGTLGRLVADLYRSIFAASGTVDSTGATASSFRTDIVADDDFYNDMLLTFTGGDLAGQTRPITSFTSVNGVFTFDEAFAAAPANGVAFQIIRDHVHPVSQIQSGLATQTSVDTIGSNVDSILADTNELQTDWANGGRLDVILDARASQTSVDDLPTNSELATALAAADDAVLTAIDALPTTAEVRTQCDDALTAINLDHLVKSAVDTNFATTVHLDSVIGQLADNGTTATFDRTTDSLEAVRDRGDSAWITATGFSTHSAADVWSVGTRTLTAIDEDSTTLDLDATIRNAVGLASANIDTQFSNLDGKVSAVQAVTDLLDDTLVDQGGGVYGFTAAALSAGDDATLAAIAALNNLSAAQVWNAATRTLTAIDEDSTTLDLDATIRGAVGMASANLDTQIGTLATAASLTTVASNVADILVDTGTDGVVVAAGSKTGYALTSGERDSIAAALLDLAAGVETNRTLRQALRLILAASAGKLSGAATSTITIRDTNDSVNRIVATCDSDGNRSAVTLDAT